MEEPVKTLKGAELDGRTAYMKPTSTTGHVQAQSPTGFPQRRGGFNTIIADSSRFVNGFLADSEKKPVNFYSLKTDSSSFDINSTLGLYCLSIDADALKTIRQPISTEPYYVKVSNPYIVTANNPIITDTDIRDGTIAKKIASIKKAGYDSIIMNSLRQPTRSFVSFTTRLPL